jgi:hypothetical protein
MHIRDIRSEIRNSVDRTACHIAIPLIHSEFDCCNSLQINRPLSHLYRLQFDHQNLQLSSHYPCSQNSSLAYNRLTISIQNSLLLLTRGLRVGYGLDRRSTGTDRVG